MYSNIRRSCVSLNGTFSAFFNCEKGVRQGENLSPILFSLFLNDMQTYIESKGGLGIESTDDQNILWLKLLVLLYADDTVILSDNEHDFQISLNAFHSYCDEWNLKVILNKTKVVIFVARNINRYSFCLGDQPIEIKSAYHCLGVTFSAGGSFLQARKHYLNKYVKPFTFYLP